MGGIKPRLQKLIPEIIPEGKARIDSCLWKGRRHSKLREGMVIEEKGIQVLTQCVVSGKFDGKQITNDILKQIQKEYKINTKTKNAITEYLDLRSVQNDKSLERYIEDILTKRTRIDEI